MFSAALVTLALATSHGMLPGHAPAPVHTSVVTTSQPHRSSSFSTGTLAQVCRNVTWLDRLLGKRDECSLVDPRGSARERAYYQACAQRGTTGVLDCHIGYSFRYVTAADRNGSQVAACYRGCAPFLADVERAEDAERAERIPVLFGGLQAVGGKLVGEIAAEASGLELETSSFAVSRTDRIVRELIRPGVIYWDTRAPRVHAIIGDLDDARALFERISQGGVDITPERYQIGGRLVQLPDGTKVGFRPNAGGGTSPSVDINIPGYTEGEIKFHFTNR